MPLRDRDHHVTRLAARADGIVDHAEMSSLGFSDSTITRRRGAGLLVPMFDGVYLVPPHPPTGRALEVAALRACGPDAALGLRSAAAAYGWLRWDGDVEVLCPTHRRRRRRLHPRVVHLERSDVVVRGGRAMTSRARTLADLAMVLGPAELDRVAHEAEFRGHLHVPSVRAVIARTPRRRWTSALEASLAARRPLQGRLDSGPEREFAHFLRLRGYPPSEHGVLFQLGDGEARLDVLFRGQWLGVEVDGGPHRSERAFHADRRRDLRFEVEHQLPIVRVTDRQIEDDPEEFDALLWARLVARDPMLRRGLVARQRSSATEIVQRAPLGVARR